MDKKGGDGDLVKNEGLRKMTSNRRVLWPCWNSKDGKEGNIHICCTDKTSIGPTRAGKKI